MKDQTFEDCGFIKTLSIIKHKKVMQYQDKPKRSKDKPDYSEQRKKKRGWDE